MKEHSNNQPTTYAEEPCTRSHSTTNVGIVSILIYHQQPQFRGALRTTDKNQASHTIEARADTAAKMAVGLVEAVRRWHTANQSDHSEAHLLMQMAIGCVGLTVAGALRKRCQELIDKTEGFDAIDFDTDIDFEEE